MLKSCFLFPNLIPVKQLAGSLPGRTQKKNMKETMALTIRNSANTNPRQVQGLLRAGLAILLLLFGLLGQNGAGMSRLVELLCALSEPKEGQSPPGDLDVVREAAQLLHFLLDTLF